MVIGNYCKTFAEATHGMPNGISPNAPYRFHWLKVVRVDGKTVHCTGAGEPMEFRIRRQRDGREFFDLVMADPIFGSVTFRTFPFKGEER